MASDEAIDIAAKKLGYFPLKDKQRLAVKSFFEGKDVFVSLPTGYGKTACFAMLPIVHDLLYGSKAVIVVVSPLKALMANQVDALMAKGLQTASITAESSPEIKSGVESGNYQIVLISPEQLVDKWRNLFLKPVYQKQMIALIFDEAHCVAQWGSSFRESFNQVGEIRSLIPLVNIMALTATATNTTQKTIERILAMKNTTIIAMSPDKTNLRYSVQTFTGISNAFYQVVQELRIKRMLFERMIIFCNTKLDCPRIFSYFRLVMGPEITEPIGASFDLVDRRLVDMYFAGTDDDIRKRILNNFTTKSPLRIVIATIAFGLGVDCPDTHVIVHVGPPSDIESYVQQVGRAGRDGSESFAFLLTSAKLETHCDKQMLNYLHNNNKTCRRDLLYNDFNMYTHSRVNNGCNCCDTCLASCECNLCGLKFTRLCCSKS